MSEKNVKVFISYSWTSPELVDWVRDELATKLLSDGVEVVLDQWELKEGHDTFQFMESMVTDASVNNVLVLCDKAYQTKADGRTGGVGTETQILTPKIYGEARQEKFLPVIIERDEVGNHFVPTYIEGRKYIDFSSEQLYIENYEDLLRTIYKRPQYRKPSKGTAPAFLFEDQETNDYKLKFLAKQIIADLERDKPRAAEGKLNEFKEKFINTFDEFKEFSTKSNEKMSREVEGKIDDMLLVRDAFIELLESTLNYGIVTIDYLIEFFEDMHNKQISIKTGSDRYAEFQFDHYKFFIRELFLYTTAILIKKEQFHLLHGLIYGRYFLYRDSTRNKKIGSGFEIFRCHLTSLEEIINPKLSRGYINYMAEKIVKRATHKRYSKVDLSNADVLLYYLSDMREDDASPYQWFPNLYVYGVYSVIEVLKKLESKRHFWSDLNRKYRCLNASKCHKRAIDTHVL